MCRTSYPRAAQPISKCRTKIRSPDGFQLERAGCWKTWLAIIALTAHVPLAQEAAEAAKESIAR